MDGVVTSVTALQERVKELKEQNSQLRLALLNACHIANEELKCALLQKDADRWQEKFDEWLGALNATIDPPSPSR